MPSRPTAKDRRQERPRHLGNDEASSRIERPSPPSGASIAGTSRGARYRVSERRHTMNILTVNLLFSTLIFWVAIRLYVLPRLAQLDPRAVLVPVLLLHAFRHLGLMFLAPGAIYEGMPRPFAYPAAFGDLLAAVLAL